MKEKSYQVIKGDHGPRHQLCRGSLTITTRGWAALSSISLTLFEKKKEWKARHTTNSARDSPGALSRGNTRQKNKLNETRDSLANEGGWTHSMKAPNTAAGGEDVDFI